MVAARRLARSSALALLIAASPALAQHASTTDAYRAQAMAELERLKADAPVVGKARNIILFIGDGMGVSTLTAARIHQGQRQGVDGESFVPTMDRLSSTALVKTYSHDGQVSDSAPTATAFTRPAASPSLICATRPRSHSRSTVTACRTTTPSSRLSTNWPSSSSRSASTGMPMLSADWSRTRTPEANMPPRSTLSGFSIVA